VIFYANRKVLKHWFFTLCIFGIKINLALPQKNIEKMNFATNENKSIS